jgi:16S rRNA (guanine527-N7)-methyltransferase
MTESEPTTESESTVSPSGDSLPAALARHGIELADDQVAALDRYVRALWSWNERLNLTRHTDYEKFVARDVVDSIQLEQLLDSGDRVLDVGTGGGVPGVILSILRPDLAVTLTESVAKKARAVTAIVQEAGLTLPVVHGRAETVLAAATFESLVVRAVAPLYKLLTWFEPHWNSIGQLLVVKGPAWAEERAAARERGLLRGLELRKAAEYETPGTGAVNVVLRIAVAE